jgi:SAM-dependent methyltransferase
MRHLTRLIVELATSRTYRRSMISRPDQRRLLSIWIDAFAAASCYLLVYAFRLPGIADSLATVLATLPLLVGPQLTGLSLAGAYRPLHVGKKIRRLILGASAGTVVGLALAAALLDLTNFSLARFSLYVALLFGALIGWRTVRVLWTTRRGARRTVEATTGSDAAITGQRPDDERARDCFLDDTVPFEIAGASSGSDIERWIQVAHCRDHRPSLLLLAGEQLRLRPVAVEEDSRLFIRYAAAVPRISGDGLRCEVSFADEAQPTSEEIIASLPVSGGDQRSHWYSAEFALSGFAGRIGQIRIRCGPRAATDATGDRLALADVCVAREHELSLVRARSFRQLRSENEVAHFSRTYSHALYSTEQDRLSQQAAGPPRPVIRRTASASRPESREHPRISAAVPIAGESSYAYAHRLLAASIPDAAPNFPARLAQRTREHPVRVLSLCSGAARVEASFAGAVGERAAWSLLDINGDLLRNASTQFAAKVPVSLIECDVNELSYAGEKWDVILCVSGLHHLVELERVIEFCHRSLSDEGEFWSIGEYVGRNGNRLWPDARTAANTIFRQLPERLRLNRHSHQVDHEIPDNDYSVGCFEAIRSEEIEPILDRWFQPVDVYRRNCFLWRLVNLAYSDNYDIATVEDREWVTKAVAAELQHFRAGGRPTELFGVYRPRNVGN